MLVFKERNKGTRTLPGSRAPRACYPRLKTTELQVTPFVLRALITGTTCVSGGT